MNLIKHQWSDTNKIYSYIQDPLESKYQLLINGRQKIGFKNLKNPKAFIDYSQAIEFNKEKESINSVWWYDSRYGF